nr:unnamed protein product [Digitaria exilis]
MDHMEQPEPEVPGHYYALQVGSYFLTGYYNVLTNQPHLANLFYTANSSVVRLDCETGQWSFGETMERINDMLMSMNVTKVEVKTANFLESWGAAITLLVTGLVQLKGYPVRKRFAQNIILAPKKDGYFIFSDIFKLICDEYDDRYHVSDYNGAENMPQVDASYTMAETGSDYFDGEPQDVVPAAENHVQQQDPSEYKAVNGIYDETHSEEHMPSFPSSTDVKQDSPLASQPPSPPPPEEPVEEAPKTYASVLRTKAKATAGTTEPQQPQQLVQHVQTAPVHEKSNLDNNRAVNAPDDEEEFISCYVGNLSPSTSVFDLEKVFQAFGRIKPDGVAIRSRKEAGVFFGFVEFEDMSGIQNALDASPIELNGRLVHVEERRPNCGFPSSRRRGRGRDQAGGRYDGEYATRSKGTGHQKKGGRQYDSYY